MAAEYALNALGSAKPQSAATCAIDWSRSRILAEVHQVGQLVEQGQAGGTELHAAIVPKSSSAASTGF
jgi:hypothetical protein